jgi:hypothetical protein
MVKIENAVEDIVKLLEVVRRTQRPKERDRLRLPVVIYNDKHKLFIYNV